MSKNCLWLTNGLHIGDTGIKRSKDDPANSRRVLSKFCCRSKQSYKDYESIDNKQLKETILPEYSPTDHVKKLNNIEVNYENFKNSVCRTCYDAEKTTGNSMRTSYESMYGKSDVSDGKVRLLQLSFGNFCNFKCRYCTPRFSTTWNEDTPFMQEVYDQMKDDPNRIGATYTQIVNTERQTYDIEENIVKQLEQVDLSELVYVGVFGGEPFLSRHWQSFVELLEKKSDVSKIRLQINSNFSIFPKPHIVKVLCKFREVDLRASVEATGKLAEYIRSGLKWTVFEKNLDKWIDISKEHKKIRPVVHMANNAFNINKIADFDEWITSKVMPSGAKPFFVQFVYTPEFLDLRKVLTKDQLDICIGRINNLKSDYLKRSLLPFVSKNDIYQQDLVGEFVAFNESLDEIRKEKLHDVNPELAMWMDENVKKAM